MDYKKYIHNLSRYQRPNQKFVCGRGLLWKKPCEFGPHISGRCGGTRECVPAKIGDRWECRRSAIAGGPCDEGPGTDGSCSNTHPPCHPKRSLRSQRGILAFGAFTLVAAIIALFLTLGGTNDLRNTVIEPGPLTFKHANITSVSGCASCHDSHDDGVGNWFLAAFNSKKLTEKCIDCHVFEGGVGMMHSTNTLANNASERIGPECITCHTEHKGKDANIMQMTDSQCNVCHEEKINAFSEDHPEFKSTYPHNRRASILYNHYSHRADYFLMPRNVDMAPNACTDCHQGREAEAAAEPMGYDKMCANCHDGDISKGELVLLRLPEFEGNEIDQEIMASSCIPSFDEWQETQELLIEMKAAVESGDMQEIDEEEYDDEYFSASEENLSEVNAYLLNVPSDELDEYSMPMQEFITALVEEGTAPIIELISAKQGGSAFGKLIAGLNSELVSQMACAWANNYEFLPRLEQEMGGWYAEGLELRYQPMDHNDTVARAWVDFNLASVTDPDEESVANSAAMRQQLLLNVKRGDRVGACTKCHSVSEKKDGLEVEWEYRPDQTRPFTKYSHSVHIALVNAQGDPFGEPVFGCEQCHILNAGADFTLNYDHTNPHSFQSNFSSISKETCKECHNDNLVQEDCQVCHIYHYEHDLSLLMKEHNLVK